MRLAPEWAAEPLESTRFDRNEVEIPRYASIESRFRGRVQSLINDYMAGAAGRDAVMRQMREDLQTAETQVFAAGRRARGVASVAISDAESAMLAGRHSRNMRYFSGFLDDIDAGKYATGRNGPMTPMRRAGMYAESLWSIYNRGDAVDWDDFGANSRHYWILDPDAEHCIDCIARARRSRDQNGFTFDELIELGFPGEATRCRTRCRCHVRSAKLASRIPPEFKSIPPANTPTAGVEQLISMLGGDQLPYRMPVAGSSGAALVLPAIEQSLNAAGLDNMGELAKRLPQVPAVLANPSVAWAPADNIRSHYRDGLRVDLVRNSAGRWLVALMSLAAAPNYIPERERL